MAWAHSFLASWNAYCSSILALAASAAARTALAPVAGVSAPPFSPATNASPNSLEATTLAASLAAKSSTSFLLVNSARASGAISSTRLARRLLARSRSALAVPASSAAIACHLYAVATSLPLLSSILALLAALTSATPIYVPYQAVNLLA